MHTCIVLAYVRLIVVIILIRQGEVILCLLQQSQYPGESRKSEGEMGEGEICQVTGLGHPHLVIF